MNGNSDQASIENIILIDFENVQPKPLTLLRNHRFRVIVFLGASQTKLPFEFVEAMQGLGDQGEYLKITGNGNNALDFHIAFYLGHLSSMNSSSHFYIISKDAGFDPLVSHLRSRKIAVSRFSSIESIPILQPRNLATKPQTTSERAEQFIAKLRNPKSGKPRSRRALDQCIRTHFGKKISEEEIEAVVQVLEERKYLKIIDGNVSYEAGT